MVDRNSRGVSETLAVAFLFVASPAFADEIYAVTPSGATEAYFDLPIVEASDFLGNQCIDLGWTMVSSTATSVVCEVPVSPMAGLLHALGGPRYATPLRQYFRFNLAGMSGLTRAQATSWQETTTAFGQTQQTEMGSANYHNSVMFFFENIGAFLPPGTEFPNHALAGFDAESVEEPTRGMRVSNVDVGGPADRAGLQAGDIIIRLAGERIRGSDDIMDGLAKATRASEYEVEFYRGGERLDTLVPVQFRETIGPLPDVRPVEPTMAVAQVASPAAPISIAEELARFAALRDQGILTDEEFDQQKARLLEFGP